MIGWQNKYLFRFVSGMAGYAVLIGLLLMLLDKGRLTNGWVAFLVALLPIFPFFNAVTAIIQNMQSQDEMQQRIQLESVMITALLTAGSTLCYGLLEATELVPHIPLFFIAPFMIFVWGIARFAVSRRYS